MMNRKAALFGAVLLMSGSLLLGQQPATTSSQTPMPMPPGDSMQMPAPSATQDQMPAMDCHAMMDKMKASAKVMDDRLAGLVSDMNKAKGSAKVDRMAAVINEMVAQRKQMRDDMAAMMPHMMQHMQSGMMGGMKSMAACPMMKDMATTSSTDTPPSEHKH